MTYPYAYAVCLCSVFRDSVPEAALAFVALVRQLMSQMLSGLAGFFARAGRA